MGCFENFSTPSSFKTAYHRSSDVSHTAQQLCHSDSYSHLVYVHRIRLVISHVSVNQTIFRFLVAWTFRAHDRPFRLWSTVQNEMLGERWTLQEVAESKSTRKREGPGHRSMDYFEIVHTTYDMIKHTPFVERRASIIDCEQSVT